MASKDITTLNPAELKVKKSSDHKVVYADNFRVGLTPWDLQLAIGRVDQVPVVDGKISTTPEVEDLFTLVISPPQAKALLSMLGTAVSGYEESFGAINIPAKFTSGRRIGAASKGE